VSGEGSDWVGVSGEGSDWVGVSGEGSGWVGVSGQGSGWVGVLGQGSVGVGGVTCPLGACELREDIYGCCPPCLETARMCPVASELFFCFKVFYILLAEPSLLYTFFCLSSLVYLIH
jgi:hypothetical protein